MEQFTKSKWRRKTGRDEGVNNELNTKVSGEEKTGKDEGEENEGKEEGQEGKTVTELRRSMMGKKLWKKGEDEEKKLRKVTRRYKRKE